MDSQPTPAIELWIAVFLERYPKCLKDLPMVAGPQGCMHKAAEEADVAVDEFNRRFGRMAEVAAELRELIDAIETPPDADTDFELSGHYYGLLMKAVPVLDSAIDQLSK